MGFGRKDYTLVANTRLVKTDLLKRALSKAGISYRVSHAEDVYDSYVPCILELSFCTGEDAILRFAARHMRSKKLE
ncbi:MAG: hypothetical protein V1889_02215 [archaeon]